MLHTILLNALNTNRIQYIAIAGSIVLLLVIFGLIRSKRLKEEYSLLWLLFGFIFLLISIFRDALEWFAQLVGIAYAPAALLLILLMAVYLILIHNSIIVSGISEKNKLMSQEIALLKKEIEDLKAK